jgi:GGDEF domain-containing protein
MNSLFIQISLGIAFVAMAANFILYRKVKVWKLILFVIFGAAYAALTWFSDLVAFFSTPLVLEIYTYALYGLVVIFLVTFRRKIKVTQNLTDYDFFEMEKELEEIKTASELLRMRYISTIELLHEGLFFYNEDLGGLFLTDQACRLLSVEEHEWTLDAFVSRIHPEDQGQYMQTLKKISKKNPSFDLKYRVKRENGYVWIEEKAKIFEYEKQVHVISTIQGVDMRLFPLTTIHEIDSLPTEPQLIQTLTQVIKEPETFYLVMIQLTNLPDINQRFGRDVGNLMIAEYIKKIRYHFAKDVNSVFRISGIQFALVIRETRKYEVLQRALQSGGDLVNLQLSIGGIQQVVYPNLGIAKHEPWSAYGISEFMSMANKALEEAVRNPKKNYAVFGE